VIAEAEVKCALREVLSRCEPHPDRPEPETPKSRTVVYVPGRGLRTDRSGEWHRRPVSREVRHPGPNAVSIFTAFVDTLIYPSVLVGLALEREGDVAADAAQERVDGGSERRERGVAVVATRWERSCASSTARPVASRRAAARR